MTTTTISHVSSPKTPARVQAPKQPSKTRANYKITEVSNKEGARSLPFTKALEGMRVPSGPSHGLILEQVAHHQKIEKGKIEYKGYKAFDSANGTQLIRNTDIQAGPLAKSGGTAPYQVVFNFRVSSKKEEEAAKKLLARFLKNWPVPEAVISNKPSA